MSQQNALPGELRQRAEQASQNCVQVAARLSAKAESAEWWERGITATNNILGILALLTASVVPISGLIALPYKDAITILAAIALVGGPYFQMAVLRDPPSRFRDFAFYIGGFADKIYEILSDVRSDRQYERLLEVLALADKNLNDVAVKWPSLGLQRAS